MIDSLDNDIVIRFASYLHSQDLVNLSLTCRRFGSSNTDSLSLMEDTAYQIICNAKEHEKEALPKLANQTYIELYSELEKYREPRVFDQLIGEDLCYIDNDKSHIINNRSGEPGVDYITLRSSTAICSQNVMRAGKHYATFTISDYPDDHIRIGVIRPLPNLWWTESFDPMLKEVSFDEKDYDYCHYNRLQRTRTERRGDSKVNYCALDVVDPELLFVSTRSGLNRCCWSDFDETNTYELEVTEECSYKIGMLLDLEAGTLTVYNNGCKTGVIKDGLSGEYCWCASIWSNGDSVRIEKGQIPTD